MSVREHLYAVALSKGLRQSTVLSYERLLGRLGLLDMSTDDVNQRDAIEALWRIDNPNTRRAAVIALGSVFGWTIKIPRGDLARGYRQEVRHLPYVRGTVDALSVSRSLMRGHTRVRCTYEEFSADIPINRLLKSALLVGLGSGTLAADAARRTRRLLARFSDVAEATPADYTAEVDRTTSRYRDALLLAIHILRSVRRELSVGTTRAWCFLWRTRDAVEAGIRETLRSGLATIASVGKEPRIYSSLRFTPDLTFGGRGRWRREVHPGVRRMEAK